MTSGAASSSSTSHPLDRHGDGTAIARFLERYAPALRRWTHGRLPHWARTSADTSDLVQDAVLRTLQRRHRFENRGGDALGAYLRVAVWNRIRDEHRRIARRGPSGPLPESLADPAPSPLDDAVHAEMERRYLEALASLAPADRELIVAHVELDYTHQQLGCMTGRTANAARMALHRAVGRLAHAVRRA
jgi:RNA polymerase sigma-70 factor (ECF subfamily)